MCFKVLKLNLCLKLICWYKTLLGFIVFNFIRTNFFYFLLYFGHIIPSGLWGVSVGFENFIVDKHMHSLLDTPHNQILYSWECNLCCSPIELFTHYLWGTCLWDSKFIAERLQMKYKKFHQKKTTNNKTPCWAKFRSN